MIVQITGKVKFPITLDPTIWIFDDRKVTFSDIFGSDENQTDEVDQAEEELKRKSMRFNRELYQQKINPPVNKSLNRYEKERILHGTFLMPLKPFLQTSEPDRSVRSATLETDMGNETVDATQLSDAYLQFSDKGKPIQDHGPVHLFFEDGSNREQPIKGIKKIILE